MLLMGTDWGNGVFFGADRPSKLLLPLAICPGGHLTEIIDVISLTEIIDVGISFFKLLKEYVDLPCMFRTTHHPQALLLWNCVLFP